MQDRKVKDQLRSKTYHTGICRTENRAQKNRTGKCTTGKCETVKWRTSNPAIEMQDHS